MPRRRARSPRVAPAPAPAGDAVTDEVAAQGALPCPCEDCIQEGMAEQSLEQSVEKPNSWVSP